MNNESNADNPLRVISVVVLALFLLGFIFEWRVLYYVGMVLLGVSLLSSTAARYLSSAWMTVARFIGTINSKILLTIIFYGFLTPIALVYRLVKGSPIQDVDETGSPESYFVDRKKQFTPNDFENPW